MARFNLGNNIGNNMGGGRPIHRTRKEGGIMSSIGGFFIGLLMVVIASPIALWYSESQHRAADFSTAQVVTVDSAVTGYVVVEGEPAQTQPLNCPQKTLSDAPAVTADATDVTADATTDTKADTKADKKQAEPQSCVYVQTALDEYNFEVKEQCGSLSSNQVQLRYLGDECDEDGTNCEPCYEVEDYDWQNQSTEEEFAGFTLGNYAITPSEGSNFIGTQELVEYDLIDPDLVVDTNTPGDYNVGDMRYSYEYLPTGDRLLVAGDAEAGAITTAYEKRPYVVSSLTYQGTLEDLQSQDDASKWFLRIVSLALMVFGMVLMVGPLTLFTNIFRVIPFLGKRVDKGIDAVISFVAALIGFVLWLLVWGIVLVVKNIWIILIILVVIGVGVLMLVKRGKKKNAATTNSGSNEPPAQTPPAAQPPVQ